MLSAVVATITAHDLLRRGDRVVVAVSGGPDSMALLHALWELRARLGLTLEVAAVNHAWSPQHASGGSSVPYPHTAIDPPSAMRTRSSAR